MKLRKGSPHTTYYQFTLPDELAEKVNLEAKRQGRARSNMIRHMVQYYMDRRVGKEGAPSE